MHAEASNWIASLNLTADRVIECGSRNVNGSARDVIAHNEWVGVDIEAGDGVDIVADWCEYRTNDRFDLVVCTEMLEHCPDVESAFGVAWWLLKPGGRMVVTCATDGRAPHSAVDGGPLRDGEWYRNVMPSEVDKIPGMHLEHIECWPGRGDMYFILRKVG